MSSLLKAFLLLVLAVQLAACSLGSSSESEPLPDGVFESDDPTKATGTGGGLSADAGAGTGGSSSGGAAGSSSSGGSGGAGAADPGKLIEEADIIQREGNTLFALSQYSGLSVIDVSVKDQLNLLGTEKLEGIPFEMYVRDGIVFAMFSSFGKYVGAQWVTTSAVVALDAKNPASIQKLGEFTVPGEVSDSRLVGDVLYVVAHQDGYCWECPALPRTTVISLDVSVPGQPKKIDELTFDGDGYSWSKRSVMATTERLYIAGPESDYANGSDVQIVDITDATGKLVKGATFPVAGVIDSRWQMDELDGVFRVVSQPWSFGIPPRVQTFTVASSQLVTPLGAVDMVLPEPETLRSVRFDGERVYAITFRQTDPLFTIDLSDPAAPKQLGELVIPGWVYHMEPRGDRLLALGYDNTNAEGSLNVSLFDVSDMTAPVMLDRVNFGGDYGEFAEDQDRIHKAFTIVDELGLIFVPYSGWQYDGKSYGCGSYESGIKIVGFGQNTLTSRGVAPAKGRARRAFLHQERLFAVSDVNVETFDITNLDAPAAKASLELSVNVTQTLQVGNKIARLGVSYWTDRATIDVTTLENVDEPSSGKLIELAEGDQCWYGGWYGAQMFASGTRLYVMRDSILSVFDLGGDTPVFLGEIEIPDPAPSDPYGYGDWYDDYGYSYGYGSLLDAGRSMVNVGDTLVLQRRFQTWSSSGQTDPRAWFVVVDASDPDEPHITTFEREQSIGFTSLFVADGGVVSTRWEPSPTTPGKVRFYLDRLDVSNPKAPALLAPINVPGSLVSIRADGKRAITADYDRVEQKTVTMDECYANWGGSSTFVPTTVENGYWDGLGTCVAFQRTALLLELAAGQASILDTRWMPAEVSGYNVASGDDRVYFSMSTYGYASNNVYPTTVVSGLTDEHLALTNLEVPLATSSYGYVSQLIPQGKRVFVVQSYPASITAVDTSNLAAIDVGSPVELMTEYPSSVSVVGDTAICSLGEYGVSTIALSQ